LNPTDNKVYCANSGSNNVTVIDGANNQVITNVWVGGNPLALVWNSLNNKVYCANRSSDDVTIIDGATNQVITTVSVGDYPVALVWNSIQNRTYVANNYSSSISVIRDSIIPGIEETTNPNAISLMPEIYPNPAKSMMRVRCPMSVNSIKIFDVSGKIVKEKVTSVQDHKQEMKISLKGINPGIYFLQLGKEVKKFIVAK
jgi:YVTN family beta-propeller protein